MSGERRWTLSYESVGDHNAWIVGGPDPGDDPVEVMSVSEHEAALAAARQMDDAMVSRLVNAFRQHGRPVGDGVARLALLAALNVPSEVGKSADVPSESASDLERARLGADLAALREAAQAVAEAVPLPGGSLAGLFTAVGRLRAALASADSEADR